MDGDEALSLLWSADQSHPLPALHTSTTTTDLRLTRVPGARQTKRAMRPPVAGMHRHRDHLGPHTPGVPRWWAWAGEPTPILLALQRISR